MKLAASATLFLSIGSMLVGCAGTTATPADSVPTGVNRPSPVEVPSSSESANAAIPTPTPTGSGVQDFGKAYTFADGLAVTVGEPQPYKPSSSAAGADRFPATVVFDVTVVNKSGKPWDPVLFVVTAQSANEEASPVFDFGKLPDRPQTKVLPGREVKFKQAFGVADPKDIVMEVQLDFQHEAVIFQKR